VFYDYRAITSNANSGVKTYYNPDHSIEGK